MNKYNINEHKDEIITDLIKKLIWVPIAAIAPVVYKIIQTLLEQYNNVDRRIFILVALSFMLSVTSIVITVLLYRKNNKVKTQDDKDNDENQNNVLPINNFHIQSVDCELCFENKERTNITCTLSYNMVAISDGVEYFEKELIWTGKTYISTELVEANGDYKLQLFDSNDAIHKYRIYFQEPLKSQDQVSFKLITKVSDDNLSMQPINSYTVKHQIDNLILRVVCKPKCIKNVKRAIYTDISRQLPVGKPSAIAKKMIAGNECYETVFANPTISYRHFIEWEFTK